MSWTSGRRVLQVTVAALMTCSPSCSPTAPSCKDAEGRGATTFNEVTVSCDTVGSALQCEAVTDNRAELYVYCPMQEDVTQLATWTVGDPAVVTMVAPGHFDAVAPGDTFLRAIWNATPYAPLISPMRPVSVFPGTPPLPTEEIFGSVYQRGSTIAAGAIDGAVIQILDGLVAGRSTTSGVPPPLLPGYLGPFGGPGYYRLLGVPPGTYRLRITKDGYASQEVSVTVTPIGSPGVDFQLVPL